jgi:hypothetical protein
MKRILLAATVSLAAANVPLAAQTPSGPVQGAVQGTVKGTATVGQGIVQGTGQAGQGIAQDLPVWRGAQVKPRSEWPGALERWRQRPAEARGESLRWVTAARPRDPHFKPQIGL